ncbi:MAG: NlpC/P60 family protein [Solirubrobacteraceae bacterium]
MSFSDAIGQVDQIVQWEQQLANPAALTQSLGTAASGTTTNTSSSDASGGASFSDALAQAQAQGGTSALSLLDPADSGTATSGIATSAADTSATTSAADTSATTSASDLLNGGDSQLLSALQPATGGASPSTGSSELSAIESALQDSTTAGTSAATSGTFGSSATSAGDPRIQSMIQEASSLIGQPYVWGGGHNSFGPQSGYDCSGFVSAVLHAGGYLTSPQDTETLPTAAGIESGPGQYVTIYDRTTPGQEGHVIMEIDGQFYESGGQQGSWGGGGGVEKISTPSAAYLSTFNQVLHPDGL